MPKEGERGKKVSQRGLVTKNLGPVKQALRTSVVWGGNP